MFETGVSRQEIDCFEMNVGLLGYGQYGNVVEGQETPLYARAFVFYDPAEDKRVAFVNMEICFPSIILKARVLELLQIQLPGLFNDSNLMITAQHTHSAPGGITQYILYNIPTPGFRVIIFNAYVKSVVDAIVEAEQNRKPASLHFRTGTFEMNAEVAFNRSVKPYNSNKEIEKPYAPDEAHLAIDRTMKLLYFKDEQGKPIGSINWFGVHTTSLSSDVNKICYDNKGYAAEFLEGALRPENQEVVCAFAQDAAGDVTPNYVWDKKKKWTRGKFECDIESAKHNGQLQSDLALGILNQKIEAEEVKGQLDALTLYFDMSKVEVCPSFTSGKKGLGTSPACLGFSFLTGTKEGPGVDMTVGKIIAGITAPCKQIEKQIVRRFLEPGKQQDLDRKYAAQEPKAFAMEAGEGEIFFIKRIKNAFFIPGIVDPVIKSFKSLDRKGWLKKGPWIPQILPLQIMTIGQLAFVGIPAEVTTMSGKRLREAIKNMLKEKGISTVILCPYANAYAGYITTPEEYQHQAYEGGHTLFGKWTLPAYQTKFAVLARELLKPERERLLDVVQPVMFAEDEIWYGE